MRELHLTIASGDPPVYLRLAAALRAAVTDGQVVPGELLPSTRSLAELVGVHRHTVMNALGELVAEGWLEPEPGRGYRVTSTLPRDALRPAPGPEPPQPAPREWKPRSPGPPAPELPRLRFAFPSGQPDLRLFPRREYYAALREVLRRSHPTELLTYADPQGRPGLLSELEVYLRRVRGITEGRVVVTHGAQEGIFLLATLLLEPGNTVAVEEMGYRPAWDALRLAGARLEPVRVDGGGLDPESLEKLARRRRVAMVYVTPLHQYPTTVTLALDRRLALYDVAARHGIAILEDDYDHEFHYRSRPLPPLKSRDPGRLVLYVSTFSKVVYPAARLGFVVVPDELAEPLARTKLLVSRQNDSLVQEAMALWMAQGGFERHLRRMRRVYQSRRDRMVAALGDVARFRVPDGGMSVWADFGVDSRRLAQVAADYEVAVRPGAEHLLEEGSCSCLRLGFASSTADEIDEGVQRLVSAFLQVRRLG